MAMPSARFFMLTLFYVCRFCSLFSCRLPAVDNFNYIPLAISDGSRHVDAAYANNIGLQADTT